MKFTGSFIGKLFLIIICIMLGAVLTVGGVALAGYTLLTQTTMGDLEEKVASDEMPIDFGEEVEQSTVLEWGTALIEAVGNMSVTTIGDLENLVGYPVLSDAFDQMIGADPEVIKSATFENLGATIADSMTLDAISEKMEISLPDMPLFSDEDFMTKPISIAFEDLTEYPLEMFVEINEEEDNPILVSFKDLTISELGTDKLNDKINNIKVRDVIEITENSNHVVQSVAHLTVGELGGDKAEKIINSLYFDEIMTINSDSVEALKGLQYASLESMVMYVNKAEYDASSATFKASEDYDATKEVSGYQYIYSSDGIAYVHDVNEKGNPIVQLVDGEECYRVYETKDYKEMYRPIIGINDKLDTMALKDFLSIDESNTLLYSLRNSRLNTLTEDVKRLFVGEMFDITEGESNKTLVAIKYSTMETVTALIPVSDVLDGYAESDKEVEGYHYFYTEDEDGDKTSHVFIMDHATGEPEIEMVEGVACYKVYETRDFEGKHRPIISIDDHMNELFINELTDVEGDSAKALQSIKYATVQSDIYTVSKSAFDASTAAFKASASYNADYELAEETYVYTLGGVAYVLKMEDGSPIVTDVDGTQCYTAYRTRFYGAKFRPLRGMNEAFDTLTVGDIIDVDTNSSPLVQSLKDTLIEDIDTAVAHLLMDEIIEMDEGTSQIVKSVRYSTLNTISKYIPKDACTAYAGSDCVDGYDYVEYNGDYYVLIYQSGLPIEEDIDGVVHYKVYETKLYQGKLYPMMGISKKMQELTVGEMFNDMDGVLGLIDPNTHIDEISTAVSSAVQDTSLATLIGVGVIDDSSFNVNSLPKEQHSFLFNSSMTEVLTGVIDFMGTPIVDVGGIPMPNYQVICPNHATISVLEFNSITEFVTAYDMYDTLLLGADLTVRVDATLDAKFAVDSDSDGNVDYYAIPMFNILEGTTYVITFDGNVKLGVVDEITGEVSDNQYGYFYYDNASQVLNAIDSTIKVDTP